MLNLLMDYWAKKKKKYPERNNIILISILCKDTYFNKCYTIILYICRYGNDYEKKKNKNNCFFDSTFNVIVSDTATTLRYN